MQKRWGRLRQTEGERRGEEEEDTYLLRWNQIVGAR